VQLRATGKEGVVENVVHNSQQDEGGDWSYDIVHIRLDDGSKYMEEAGLLEVLPPDQSGANRPHMNTTDEDLKYLHSRSIGFDLSMQDSLQREMEHRDLVEPLGQSERYPGFRSNGDGTYTLDGPDAANTRLTEAEVAATQSRASGPGAMADDGRFGALGKPRELTAAELVDFKGRQLKDLTTAELDSIAYNSGVDPAVRAAALLVLTHRPR
jgi:hypothetical protein